MKMAGSSRKKLKEAAAVVQCLTAEVMEGIERGTETQKKRKPEKSYSTQEIVSLIKILPQRKH